MLKSIYSIDSKVALSSNTVSKLYLLLDFILKKQTIYDGFKFQNCIALKMLQHLTYTICSSSGRPEK